MSGEDLLYVTHLSYEGEGAWALRFNGASALFWEMIEQLRADHACWKPALFAGRGGWLIEEEQLFTYVDRFSNLRERIRRQGEEMDEERTQMDIPRSLQAACSVLHISMRMDMLSVRKQYRDLSKLYHPDTGGNHLYFVALQNAYEQVMAYLQAGGKKTA